VAHVLPKEVLDDAVHRVPGPEQQDQEAVVARGAPDAQQDEQEDQREDQVVERGLVDHDPGCLHHDPVHEAAAR